MSKPGRTLFAVPFQNEAAALNGGFWVDPDYVDHNKPGAKNGAHFVTMKIAQEGAQHLREAKAQPNAMGQDVSPAAQAWLETFGLLEEQTRALSKGRFLSETMETQRALVHKRLGVPGD